MSTPPPPPPPGFNSPQYGAPQQPYGAPQQSYGAPPPGYQAYNQPYQAGREYAGVGARFGAVLIDGLIGALFSIPAIIAIFAVPRHYADCTVNGESGICKVPTGAGWAIIVALALLGSITYLAIYCKKVGSSQSWGQKACGVRVVDKDTGAQIGTGRAVGRYFAKIISAAPCYLGFFWALWDKDKQTFHDKIVGTVVIKA